MGTVCCHPWVHRSLEVSFRLRRLTGGLVDGGAPGVAFLSDDINGQRLWAIDKLDAYWQGLESWVARYRWEILLVVLCTGVAAFLRVYRLAELPPGLHGDEALTGLDALRILDEGWIGPYVGSALGQPTGPLYFTAFLLRECVRPMRPSTPRERRSNCNRNLRRFRCYCR